MRPCPLRARRAPSSTPSRPFAFESLEPRQLLAATPITIDVAGTTGTEQFQLQIDGVAVATWTNTRVFNSSTRVFDKFTYTAPNDVAINRIRVAFVNDGNAPSGVNRDLFVDGITVNGAKFETEANTVYSTGVANAAGTAAQAGYRQSEKMHFNGNFQFGSAKSTIQVRAAGKTGQEQMLLQVAGVTVATYNNVAGNYSTGQFVTFNYTHTGAIPVNQIRVVYANDGNTSGGVDKNLRVDGVTLDGIRYESEAADVFGTGYIPPGGTTTPGKWSTEYLYTNGFLQYGATGSVIEVRAAGKTGQEQMQIQVAGQPVATFTNIGGNYNTGVYQTFIYLHPTNVALNQLRVAYINDGNTSAGVDKNLRVDAISLDGITTQAEAANTYSTGYVLTGYGTAPGLWQSEYLYVNGYLQFASTAVPGTLALGSNVVNVLESAGNAAVPVVRTGGSDGTVALRYTTVNATATAGSDYTGASAALIVFAPGETSKSILIPLTNDTANEGNESFNVAVDQALGGANVGAPRTATITIVDNDGTPAPGNGNGLLAEYFNNIDLTSSVFLRTDTTVNFNWGDGSPAGSIGADTFSVRWVGQVMPRYSETFTFRTTSDDGVRLWVNNQLVIDQWNDHDITTHTGTISLLAGIKYSIKMEYYENTGHAVAKLEWSSPSQAVQVIPQSQLFSDAPPPSETGTFSGQTIISGLSTPTAMDFASDGRIFVSEQRGVVKVYQNGQLLSTPFLDIQNQVNFVQDRGMLGVVLHPNFPQTPYVYVSYTYDPPEAANNSGLAGRDGAGNRVARVSRFTANAATGYNTAVAGSEVVLIGTNSTWANISHPEIDSTDNVSIPSSGGPDGTMRDILIADSRSHTVGNVGFGPDGMLYVASGDGTSFGRVDPRTTRVQNLDSLSGKILRVDPITGKGLSDNPFYNGDADSNRSKVYDYGLRNPFRFAFQPGTGTLFVGDVGWNTWEEINRGRGQNFGWPYYEGGSESSNRTGGYQDLSEAQAFYNSGQSVTPSLWARQHSAGAVAIVAGDFYTGTLYPTKYRNSLLISDFGDEQLRVVTLNADGSLKSVDALGVSVGGVVEMTMGRDGYMYYVDLVNGNVGRLTFAPSGSAPLAATMAPTSSAKSLQSELGSSPLTVSIASTSTKTTTTAVAKPVVESLAASGATTQVATLGNRSTTRPAITTSPATASTRDAAFETVANDAFAWRQAM